MTARLLAAFVASVVLLACSETEGSASNGGSPGAGGAGGAGTGGAGGVAGGGAGGSGGVAGGGGGSGPGGAGGASTATIFFREEFEDGDFAGRGWYDGPSGTLTTVAPRSGASAFECDLAVGESSCSGGKPARHKFTPSDTAYVGMWIRFSPGYVGSGRAYHPHMFHFTTTADGDYIGPSRSHLTTYVEVLGLRPMLALQDGLNVDDACILRNDDSFVGCNGDFATYPFDEDRSVASCNGIAGDLDARDCFDAGGGQWYSSRAWLAAQPYFTDAPGPAYKGDWHRLEAYFAMNSIEAGVGVPDGKLRLWVDGNLLITSDAILFRTAANPTMQFDQFLVLPYIGDGSPVAQQFWLDDLVVADGRP